jgi:hypothetical protein
MTAGQSWHIATASAAQRVFEWGIAWAAEHDAPGLQIACRKGIAALEAEDGAALVEALVGVGHYGRDPQFRAKVYQTVCDLKVRRQRRASQRGAKARTIDRDRSLVAKRYQMFRESRVPVKLIERIKKEFGIGIRQAQKDWKLFRELP